MIFLTSLLQFIGVYLEIYYLKIISKKNNQENFYSAIASTFVFLISCTFFIIFSDNDFDQVPVMLSDYRIYISLALETTAFYLFRVNYKKNHNNLTAVKMGIFSSVFLVPIIAYFFTDFFGYTTTIVVNYSSGLETFILIALTIALYMTLFQIRNKHNPIPNPLLLILLCIVAPLAMYFAVKNIQLFDGFLFFALVGFVNFIIFISISAVKDEDMKIAEIESKAIAKIFFALIFVYWSAPIVAKVFSAEFLTIIKRVFAISVGISIDKKSRQCRWRDVISATEIAILICLILVGVYMQLKT